jgi:glycogen synthase
LAGITAKLSYGIPLVLTVHSLEPLRPWKREQLGGGYDFSLWVEKTAIELADAVVAVSAETRRDVLRLFDIPESRVHIIHNGIDPDEYRPVASTAELERYGIDPGTPYVLFVGRITRQKGIVHLVNAIRFMDPGFQVVLCAGAPDTPEIAAEMKAAVASARAERGQVIWIEEMVAKKTVYELYSHAAVFCCPSIYEPFGIINLEAMACETPVVASAVGGIKEVVLDGETGYLVPLEQQAESPFEALYPERFARDMAGRINQLMGDARLRARMGQAGRRRAVEEFSWRAIAEKTAALYRSLADPCG